MCLLMQETLVAECDLGRDYEHCLELQKKVNDTEAVSGGICFHYISEYSQRPRSTQPGHPSVGRRN